MYNIKAIEKLNMILEEISNDEDSICYVSNDDKETLELAILALRQQFTKEEINQIKFALDYLHDSDLSNFNEEDVSNMESAMTKLDMQFVSQL